VAYFKISQCLSFRRVGGNLGQESKAGPQGYEVGVTCLPSDNGFICSFETQEIQILIATNNSNLVAVSAPCVSAAVTQAERQASAFTPCNEKLCGLRQGCPVP
jgi:hypothetical protein